MQSKCPRNKLHIFSISKEWNELHNQWKKRKTSSKPLEPMDGQGNQRSSQIWWRNEPELSPLSWAKNSKNNNKWAEWLGWGRGKEIRGPGAFCPGWCLQPGQNSLAPLSPSLSPRPSHSAHLFLQFLARERGVLAHFFTTFVKIFDSPVHPSALKVWGLFFSSSLACIAHFML